ncbi:hypothetical protein ONS96_003910 [Cadophora gregata f. sp. sojae]|nr:hypothetical protein ONS96_003910 [Cadophora gregata f. sp. sojae]
MPTDTNQSHVAELIKRQQYHALSLESPPGTRLLQSKTLPPDTPYLTLSHRWGSWPSIQLSSTTSFLLWEDISRHLLHTPGAAVFRHAIQVTRSLGFRYLWIDALCIMQDNDIEKMQEIMRMDDIYLNCALNIAATEGTVDGLVFDRNVHQFNRDWETVRRPNKQSNLCLKAFCDWSYPLHIGELNRRGWVFQERYLAPRIVHFTKDQVYWECRCLWANEIIPSGSLDAYRRREPKPIPFENSSTLTYEQKDAARIQWYNLLELYSRTLVTFPNDRLLAISGIAKRYCKHAGLNPSDYLAGMWKLDTPLSLLWHEPGSNLPRRPEAIPLNGEAADAPTWSWASILTDAVFVMRLYASFQTRTEVLAVKMYRCSPNPFGGAK